MDKWQVASGKWAKFIIHHSSFLLLFLSACTAAQSVPTRTTADTGIAVADEFASFYEEMGGQRIFGDPITEGFEAPDNGRFVQYFHAMRLEVDEAAQTVAVYPLGEWALAGLEEPVLAAVPENRPARAFPETDLIVQDEFLSFYDAYNGEQLLGPPISLQLDEGDLRVQYFRNGRLEWRPELPIDQRIQISYLGQAHFDAEMAFSYRQNQFAQPVPFAGIRRVDVFTSVETAVLYAGDTQTLYVTVFTPEGRPVEGIAADVTMTVDNVDTVISLGRTDAQGRIVAPLGIRDISPGKQVQVWTAVYSSSGELIGSSALTFKTWW